MKYPLLLIAVATSLQAAHKAYKKNDGSMKTLLTSDAFLFRKVETKISNK